MEAAPNRAPKSGRVERGDRRKKSSHRNYKEPATEHGARHRSGEAEKIKRRPTPTAAKPTTRQGAKKTRRTGEGEPRAESLRGKRAGKL